MIIKFHDHDKINEFIIICYIKGCDIIRQADCIHKSRRSWQGTY